MLLLIDSLDLGHLSILNDLSTVFLFHVGNLLESSHLTMADSFLKCNRIIQCLVDVDYCSLMVISFSIFYHTTGAGMRLANS